MTEGERETRNEVRRKEGLKITKEERISRNERKRDKF